MTFQTEASSSESGSTSSTSSTSSSSSGSSSGSSSSDLDSSSSDSSDSDQKKKPLVRKPEPVKKPEPLNPKTKPVVEPKAKENVVAKARKIPVLSKPNNIYSDSESESSSSPQKSNSIRKSFKPKSSATVTPAPKSALQPKVGKSPPKKSDPGRRNSRSKTPAKELIQSVDLELEKKRKSIFSPERPDTPPPPKLTPMKPSPPKKTAVKPRPTASVTLKKASSTSEKSRTSSVSSSVSSGIVYFQFPVQITQNYSFM